MEGLTELIPFLVEEGNSLLWSDFLKTCQELKIFVKNANEVVPLINSLMNEPQNRFYGFRILDTFLTQCPRNVISEQIVQWLHQCLKGTAPSSFSSQCILSFTVIRKLLEVSLEFPDVRKQTSQVFVPKILDVIVDKLKDSSSDYLTVLQCLQACLFYYGKSCGNHKQNLERLLLNLVVCERNVIFQVSKCFHLLAQVGPPGAELCNYKQNWLSQHLIMINSLHFVLDQLFSDVEEILGSFQPCSIEKKKLDMPVVNDEYPLIKSYKLGTLFCGLCQMMECMLLDSFPTYKKIYPQAIFGVVCRTLAVTCKSLESKVSNSSLAVMSQICNVHIAVIKLLNSLILCSRTNLLPFSALVTKLFTQIFKSTDVDNWVQGRERPFSRVREIGYKCLLTWLSFGKSCSLNAFQVNFIIESIVKDIKFEKKVVNLNLEQKKNAKSSKKITLVDTTDLMEMNVDTCEAALACIPPLLKNELPLTVVKNLQEVVVKLIFEIQRVLHQDKGLPPPYSNSKCRSQLYSALLALCISPHPQFPPPLHYANVLFNAASSDCDVLVQRVCSSAVNSIAHMLRPCAPSFDFHTELDSEIIPINSYPELSDHEMKYLSKRSYQEFKTSKKQLKEANSVKPKVNQESENGKPATVIVSPKEKNSNVGSSESKELQNKTIDTNINEGLIDLDDSSSDSLILIDSKGSDSSKINSSEKNALSNVLDEGSNYRTNHESEPVNKDNVSEDLIIIEDKSLTSKRFTRSSARKEDVDISKTNSTLCEPQVVYNVIECESNSSRSGANVLNNCVNCNQIKDKCECITKNLDVEFVNTEVDKKCDDVKKRSKGQKSNESPTYLLASDSEVIDLEEHSSSKTNTSKTSSVLDIIYLGNIRNTKANKKKQTPITSVTEQHETEILDDVSVIEPLVSPRRSRRQYGLSQSNKNSDCVEEVTVINDEEEPPTKKVRSNRHSLYEKPVESDSGKENDKLLSQVSNICEIVDDEDELMNSFVDAVPD